VFSKETVRFADSPSAAIQGRQSAVRFGELPKQNAFVHCQCSVVHRIFDRVRPRALPHAEHVLRTIDVAVTFFVAPDAGVVFFQAPIDMSRHANIENLARHVSFVPRLIKRNESILTCEQVKAKEPPIDRNIELLRGTRPTFSVSPGAEYEIWNIVTIDRWHVDPERSAHGDWMTQTVSDWAGHIDAVAE